MSPCYTESQLSYNLMYTIDYTSSYRSKKFICLSSLSSVYAHGTKFIGRNFILGTLKDWDGGPLTRKFANRCQVVIQGQGRFTKHLSFRKVKKDDHRRTKYGHVWGLSHNIFVQFEISGGLLLQITRSLSHVNLIITHTQEENFQMIYTTNILWLQITILYKWVLTSNFALVCRVQQGWILHMLISHTPSWETQDFFSD